LDRKRSASFLRVTMAAVLLLLSCACLSHAQAEEVTEYPTVQISRVIEVANGGTLIVRDALTLSSADGQKVKSLGEFQIGFPLVYKGNLVYNFSYDSSGRLSTRADSAGLEEELSWISVAFPKQVDVSDGRSYSFTVVLVFSQMVEANESSVHASFPLYPGLPVESLMCNVTIALPNGASFDSASPIISNRTVDSALVLYSDKSPLQALANVSAWVEFTMFDFAVLDVGEWTREVAVDSSGAITVTDFYQVVNKAEKRISKIHFALPPNATNVAAQDVYGAIDRSKLSVVGYEDRVEVEVYLRELLGADQRVKLLIAYSLPSGMYIAQKGWQDYTLNVSLVRFYGYVARRFTVVVSLPEGAEFQTASKTPTSVEREGLLVKAKFTDYNVTALHEQTFSFDYRYLTLWSFFRPALWVGIVALVGGSLLLVRRVSRPVSVVEMALSPDVVKRFLDAYEERRRLESELYSLEQRVQKGKISRREYKLRRSSLDGRLSRLQKDLTDLRREIGSAGSRYLERMRHLETSEAEIDTLDRDIERVEARYKRREVSAEAYRRLVDEYNRIKERAENRIAEILLRLREETR